MDEENLIARAREGDPCAQQQIYRLLIRPIARFFAAHASNLEPDDRVQETFVRLFERLRDGAELRNLRPYTFGISRIVLIEALQEKNERAPIDPEHHTLEALQPGASTIAHLRQEHRLIASAFRNIPIDQQLLLYLRHFEGMRSVDIAEALEVDASTMRTRTQTARRQLEAAIDKLQASSSIVESTTEHLDDWLTDMGKLWGQQDKGNERK